MALSPIRHRIRITNSIQGHFHQATPDNFSAESIGKQCTTNALLSQCRFPGKKGIEPKDIDEILIAGDLLYHDAQRPANDKYTYMAFDNLPKTFTHGNTKYIVTHKPACY